jgi:hypothetical protein
MRSRAGRSACRGFTWAWPLARGRRPHVTYRHMAAAALLAAMVADSASAQSVQVPEPVAPAAPAPAAPAPIAPVPAQPPVAPAPIAPVPSNAPVQPSEPNYPATDPSLQPSAAALPDQSGLGPPRSIESPEVRPVTDKDRSHCLLGELCLGPVLTAGALDVFGIGAQARTDHWGVGIDYQFIDFTTKGVPSRLSLLTVEGRIYPFAGAFFVAGGLAWQYADFKGKVTFPGNGQIPPIDTVITGNVSVPVFKLGIGFMGREGFVMGIDLAFGLQLGRTKVAFSSDLPRVQQVIDVENRIRDRADTFVRGLPFLLQLNLLRFGFLF